MFVCTDYYLAAQKKKEHNIILYFFLCNHSSLSPTIMVYENVLIDPHYTFRTFNRYRRHMPYCLHFTYCYYSLLQAFRLVSSQLLVACDRFRMNYITQGHNSQFITKPGHGNPRTSRQFLIKTCTYYNIIIIIIRTILCSTIGRKKHS